MPARVTARAYKTRSGAKSSVKCSSRGAHDLDAVLRERRVKPRALRALQAGDFAALFSCKCPRRVRYVPSPRIAKEIADRVMRRVLTKRRTSKSVVFAVHRELRRMPLRIGVDRPCRARSRNTKATWYAVGIRDELLRSELSRRLRLASYTSRQCAARTKRYGFKTLCVLTYQ